MQIDFSAAFDRVNQHGILYKLCSVDNGGYALSILIQFPSNRSQHVMVSGCRSKLVNVMSGWPEGSVLGPLLFLLYTSEFFSILENKLIGYADDSTLIAVVPSPGFRVTVAESLSHDLIKVSQWCELLGTKLYASKTKTISLQVTHNASLVTTISQSLPSHYHYFLEETFGVLSCPFWSTVPQCGARLQIHTLTS